MKRILFVLYAVMMLAVSSSCAHKETPSDLAEQTKSEVEEEILCVDFFGKTLSGKDVASIVKEMEERVEDLSLDGDVDEDEGRAYCKVLFCGVPCGMNMDWEKKDGVVYVLSLNFMTSQHSKEAIGALVKGISSFYGKPQQDEQDEMDDYYHWNGAFLRPVHSEDGGMVAFFD